MLPGLLLLIGLTQTAPPAARGAAPPTAEQLLARMRARYAECRTYREEATGRQRYRGHESLTESDRWLFAFERPDRFRFEHGTTTSWQYRGEEVFWRDHDRWRRWSWSGHEPSEISSEHVSIEIAYDHLFAAWILTLLDAPGLLRDLGERPWQRARPTGVVGSDRVDGVACTRVDLELPSEDAQVWIDEGGAIRRIVVDGKNGQQSHEELELAPEFDVALDPGDLALRPPGRSGVRPSTVIHALGVLALLTMGTIGILLGLRLHREGHPFTVSASLFGWFAATLGGAEIFGRLADQLHLVLKFRVESLFILALIVVSAWPLVRHLRRNVGFHVVGVDHGTFLTAMRAVATTLHLPARISAALPKITIDGREFVVAARPSWSMYGLLSGERGSRELLDRMRPLVGACFESDALPANRAAGLRCIGWSVVMIAGALALGLVLFGLFDRL